MGAAAGFAASERDPPVKAGAGGGTDFFNSDSGGMNESGYFGRSGVTPGELFGRISGVIITTSSVWSRFDALLLNR